MNERMLELYKQAQVPHTAIDPSNNMPYETTCFSAEKFAELIVQECVVLCKNQSRFYAETENKGTATAAADVCGIIIKQHFEVRE